MLALSTAYFTLRDEELAGEELTRRVLALGFRQVELDYRVTGKQLAGLRPFLARGELEAVSVHHPFPRPPHIPAATAHSGGPVLTSLDREERAAAIRIASESLVHAEDLGIGTVILHLGRVELPAEFDVRELERAVRAGRGERPEYTAAREAVAAARRVRSAAHLDAALSALDRLAGEALRRGVRMGLENRYHPEEIPDPAEAAQVFHTLEGAPLGYWHDTGHAASLHALGFLGSPVEGLEALADRLLGCHLHDARGLHDHLAPGEGELDFSALAPFLRGETLRVLEVHPASAPDALQRARDVLREAGALA